MEEHNVDNPTETTIMQRRQKLLTGETKIQRRKCMTVMKKYIRQQQQQK